MDKNYYINKVKFQLTGNVLISELNDASYEEILDLVLQEVNRYYDSTQLVGITGGNSCIDLTKVEEDNNIKINTVAAIFRTKPNGTASATSGQDPMLIAQWNLANNYYNYGTNRWAYNYMAYNTTNQLANTLSTDLDFREDKSARKLYINFTNNSTDDLTIEYIPKIQSVEEINSDYWINIILKLTLAYAKITLGRIRTRYTQSNSLWTQDGETMLTEGQEELKALEETLTTKNNVFFPLD